jgi:hypothetical protein
MHSQGLPVAKSTSTELELFFSKNGLNKLSRFGHTALS